MTRGSDSLRLCFTAIQTGIGHYAVFRAGSGGSYFAVVPLVPGCGNCLRFDGGLLRARFVLEVLIATGAMIVGVVAAFRTSCFLSCCQLHRVDVRFLALLHDGNRHYLCNAVYRNFDIVISELRSIETFYHFGGHGNRFGGAVLICNGSDARFEHLSQIVIGLPFSVGKIDGSYLFLPFIACGKNACCNQETNHNRYKERKLSFHTLLR